MINSAECGNESSRHHKPGLRFAPSGLRSLSEMTKDHHQRKRPKSAQHHWWPRSLSKYWAADDGCVTQLRWDGQELRLPPSKFGSIGNAHHLKFSEDGPCNSSFEDDFHKADDAFPSLAEWLLNLDIKRASKNAPFQDRFLAQAISKEQRHSLSECLASLIVRSPRSRNNIRLLIEPAREGLPDPRADKTLIAANMHRSLAAFRRAIEGAGKFVVIVSEFSEFVWGDGFLHNFPVVADHVHSCRFIIPVLPTVSVLFVQPLVYRTQPELMTFLLRKDEVDVFNETVQIYSRDFIFYRNEKPTLSEHFPRHEFLEYEFHDPPAFRGFVANAVDFVPKPPGQGHP
jgi:hypothetical protein